MINGFDSFPRGIEPLRYHFTNNGDHWFAEIGFTGSPLGDEVHAVIQFTPVGADALPSYYCRTLTDRTALAPLRLRREAPEATIVAVASGEVYGPPERLPVGETAPLRPQNPYAVSKASADLLAGFYADAYGVRVIRARAFNHAGPGQAPVYAIASFARQFAAAVDAGENPVRIVTGNPDTRRDYTDVRDVVRAYRLLTERPEPGVYNICSGRTASSRELVAMLADAAGVAVEHVVDSAKLRPHEVMELRGSFDALRAATGWEPEIPLAQTLVDTLAWWRRRDR